jgi:hypothetical protein
MKIFVKHITIASAEKLLLIPINKKIKAKSVKIEIPLKYFHIINFLTWYGKNYLVSRNYF